jgi:glycerol-3-phosphate acyltransferase PlsX
MDLIKSGKADAFVTAGNSGAAMVTALLRLGRLRGIERPAIAPVFPTATGSCVVLDVGANPDCKPENLLQFAIMGSVYAKWLRLRTSAYPSEEKGRLSCAAPAPASGLNYYGMSKARVWWRSGCHDGFVGNVILKTAEAVGKLIVARIKRA